MKYPNYQCSIKEWPKETWAILFIFAKTTSFLMKGVVYMTYIAKILFTNKTLSDVKIGILKREFVERREIAVNILNPMYEKWNKEFNELYPNKNGYSNEYLNFIRSKQMDAINTANAKTVGKNHVQLRLDEVGDIFGVCDEWNTTIKLCLIQA